MNIVRFTALSLGCALLAAVCPLESAAASAAGPSAPTTFSAVAKPKGRVQLSWSVSRGGTGQLRYQLTRDGVRIASLTGTTYVDAPRRESTYRYSVRAVDSLGRRSTSTSLVATNDATSPSVPAGLVGTSRAQTIELAWRRSNDNRPGAVRYHILRDGQRVATVTTTTYIETLPRTGRYTYRVRAVDQAGNASGPSVAATLNVKNTPKQERPAWAGQLIERGPSDQPKVALTIDDCYATANVREMVRILREHKATATFFCTGEAIRKAPETFADLARHFPLANHTWNHPNLRKLTPADVELQVTRTTRQIELVTGQPMTPLMRPPYGATNDSVLGVLGDLGLAVIRWDIDIMDYDASMTPAQVRDRALTAGNGSIVLMHDRGRSVKALPEIITGLRAKGFELVTLNELLSIPGEAKQ